MAGETVPDNSRDWPRVYAAVGRTIVAYSQEAAAFAESEGAVLVEE